MGDNPGTSNALGPNEWLVDEMYEQYLANPASVSASWQEFFADYRRDEAEPVPVAPAAPAPADAAPAATAAAPATPVPTAPAPRAAAPPDGEAKPIRGVAAKIVENMEASL